MVEHFWGVQKMSVYKSLETEILIFLSS